jgi:asparagine synthase (glutamine-hydrolysing)
MLSECGNYCITFNGEIYNTDALKQMLLPFRIQYVSTSDTEILLYSLVHLGVKETLQAADGIFAFAFYNICKNALVLARDRVGIKPLYMGHTTGGVVYSSQYDHIINHPHFKTESITPGAIGSFLSLGYIPETYGAVNKTSLLMHGHYYVIENGKVDHYHYYDYPAKHSISSINSLDEILSGAVKSQLVSDVPLGTFMSGGVDSTLVTYFARQQGPINSFTIGIKDHKLDESAAAEEFAGIFKTTHHNRHIHSHDLLRLIEENTKAFSEPFADFSSLPTLMLSKFAREKVTVALSGDGGDELFWGYPRNTKALQNIRHYKGPAWLRRSSLLKNKIIDAAGTDLSRHWNEPDFITYYYHALFITGAMEWLPRIFKEEAFEDSYFNEIKRARAGNLNNDDDYMNIVRKLETDIHLQRILLKVDRASMYHSLEVRVPLLSNNVLDASAAFSYKDCIKKNTGKINLKHSLINKTNEHLVMQPKKGFVIPMGEWMRHELKNDVTEKILNMPGHLAVMFKKNELEKLVAQHIAGEKDRGWFIWAVYSLVNWDAYHRNNKVLSA